MTRLSNDYVKVVNLAGGVDSLFFGFLIFPVDAAFSWRYPLIVDDVFYVSATYLPYTELETSLMLFYDTVFQSFPVQNEYHSRWRNVVTI